MAKKEKSLSFFNLSCVLRVVLHVVLHVCCMCVACRVACRVAWQVYILPKPPRPPRASMSRSPVCIIGAMAAASLSSGSSTGVRVCNSLSHMT